MTVSFVNKTTDANSYLWDFGDGSTSTEKDPVHIYKQEGSYNVSLTATNISKSDTYTLKVEASYITPEPSFTYTTKHPFYVYLTSTSKNAQSCKWEVDGGGGYHYGQNIVLQFPEAGVYKIRLFVENGTKVASCAKDITLEAPTTCYLQGFKFDRVPTDNCYYQLQLTDDYISLKTTYLYTRWIYLSSTNLPYEYKLAGAKKIDTSKDYVLRLYKSATSPSETQASGDGDFSINITSQKLSQYPEVIRLSGSDIDLRTYFIWE